MERWSSIGSQPLSCVELRREYGVRGPDILLILSKCKYKLSMTDF
jgi:hypothetical protein